MRNCAKSYPTRVEPWRFLKRGRRKLPHPLTQSNTLRSHPASTAHCCGLVSCGPTPNVYVSGRANSRKSWAQLGAIGVTCGAHPRNTHAGIAAHPWQGAPVVHLKLTVAITFCQHQALTSVVPQDMLTARYAEGICHPPICRRSALPVAHWANSRTQPLATDSNRVRKSKSEAAQGAKS